MYKGKTIYNPNGKAGEYAKWACNLYVGCSNMCSYCYCKTGVLATAMGQDEAQLKRGFNKEADAFDAFVSEISKREKRIIEDGGIFFSFSTDPCLPKTFNLTKVCASWCLAKGIPVSILTKRADWMQTEGGMRLLEFGGCNLAVGFTLTGHDELEPNASSNNERVMAMVKAHEMGCRTFASIEPIIDFKSSLDMIISAYGYCDLFRVGLRSGGLYMRSDAMTFVNTLKPLKNTKFYIKDSLRKLAEVSVDDSDNFVPSDYNIFKKA